MPRNERQDRPSRILRLPPNPGDNPLNYDVFSRYVRQFKTQRLLRMVAEAQHLEWLDPNRRPSSNNRVIAPHAASLIAFEAMSAWGAHGQRRPARDDIRRLSSMVIGLEDPILTDEPLESTDDLMVRVSFQQFLYQQPPFNDMARLRPMFSRTYSRDKFSVVSSSFLKELLGTDIDTYADLAPFFLAAVMTNDGMFDPSWFGQPNFEDVNALIAPEHALKVFDLMCEDPAHFREAARQRRHDDSRLRQYDFNPFVAKPFVTMPNGTGLAPQPTFVTGRFAPNAIFYAGSEHFGSDRKQKNQFFKELGFVNEDYVVAQLSQLASSGAVVARAAEYAPGSESIDVSVVMDGQLLFFEVKSTRPIFTARYDADVYRGHMGRDIHRAFEQLEITHTQWLAGNLPILPAGLPVHAFVVTPEPFHMANWASIRTDLPKVPFPVAIISFTELEELVSAALADGAPTAFLQAATPHPSGALEADPRGAIKLATERHGATLRNPMLDDGFGMLRRRVAD